MKFEVDNTNERSSTRLRSWKNIIVIDDWGLNLFENLKAIHVDETFESVRDSAVTDSIFEKFFKIVSERNFIRNPAYRRGLGPTVEMFDIRTSFEFSLTEMRDYLSRAAKQLIGSAARSNWFVVFLIYIFWFFVMFAVGFCILNGWYILEPIFIVRDLFLR